MIYLIKIYLMIDGSKFFLFWDDTWICNFRASAIYLFEWCFKGLGLNVMGWQGVLFGMMGWNHSSLWSVFNVQAPFFSSRWEIRKRADSVDYYVNNICKSCVQWLTMVIWIMKTRIEIPARLPLPAPLRLPCAFFIQISCRKSLVLTASCTWD